MSPPCICHIKIIIINNTKKLLETKENQGSILFQNMQLQTKRVESVCGNLYAIESERFFSPFSFFFLVRLESNTLTSM